ncbi:MAG: tol-pal system protein YbgF, partial [Pseudomonadota bacterium]|nr:tol-pal system protein YbgF [Pseudomonadota bacterium]
QRAARSNNRELKIAPVPGAGAVQRSGNATGGSTIGGGNGLLGTLSQRDLADGQSRLPDANSRDGQMLQPQSQTKTPKKRILPAGTAQEQYRYAFGLVRRADFGSAVDALEEFIEMHPDKPLTVNARYWLGRTHFVRKEYRTAAEVFLMGYQAQPKGKKAADNLLRLGMSLAGLKQVKEACTTFDKLQNDFPDIDSVVRKQLKKQRQKNGCS